MRLLLLLSLMLTGCGQSGDLYRPVPPPEPQQAPVPETAPEPDEKKKEP